MIHAVIKIIPNYSAEASDHIRYLTKIGPSSVALEDILWSYEASEAMFTNNYDLAKQWLDVASKWSDICCIISRKE